MKNMKTYIAPQMEAIVVDDMDIIRTSGGGLINLGASKVGDDDIYSFGDYWG